MVRSIELYLKLVQSAPSHHLCDDQLCHPFLAELLVNTQKVDLGHLLLLATDHVLARNTDDHTLNFLKFFVSDTVKKFFKVTWCAHRPTNFFDSVLKSEFST